MAGWVGGKVKLYNHSSAQPTGFSYRSECGNIYYVTEKLFRKNQEKYLGRENTQLWIDISFCLKWVGLLKYCFPPWKNKSRFEMFWRHWWIWNAFLQFEYLSAKICSKVLTSHCPVVCFWQAWPWHTNKTQIQRRSLGTKRFTKFSSRIAATTLHPQTFWYATLF